LAASFGRSRIARAAVVAVDIGAGFSLGNFGLIFEQLSLAGFLKGYVFGLRRATACAGFLRAGVFGAAIGTNPFQFDIADSFSRHRV
jgi:hypothetical protein